MKFLCDVHIPYKLVQYLRDKGGEAYHINHVFNDPCTKDSTICKYADDNGLIVITKDTDFKESYIVRRTPRKLIKLNTGNSSTKQIIFLFERNWDTLLKVAAQETFYIESDLLNFFLLTGE